MLVDTDVHDGRTAVPFLRRSRQSWPKLGMVFADAGFRSKTVTGPPN
jgi:hypothetical protein